MIAFFLLSGPGALADDEVDSELAFLCVSYAVLDGPVDVCGPGHLLIDFSRKIFPGKGTEAKGVSELNGERSTLRGRSVEGWFMEIMTIKLKGRSDTKQHNLSKYDVIKTDLKPNPSWPPKQS
jgi:hypothetical protein